MEPLFTHPESGSPRASWGRCAPDACRMLGTEPGLCPPDWSQCLSLPGAIWQKRNLVRSGDILTGSQILGWGGFYSSVLGNLSLWGTPRPPSPRALHPGKPPEVLGCLLPLLTHSWSHEEHSHELAWLGQCWQAHKTLGQGSGGRLWQGAGKPSEPREQTEA